MKIPSVIFKIIKNFSWKYGNIGIRDKLLTDCICIKKIGWKGVYVFIELFKYRNTVFL